MQKNCICQNFCVPLHPLGASNETGRNLRPVIDHNIAKKNEIVKVEQEQIPTTNHIENLIVDVRGKQTMLDRDFTADYLSLFQTNPHQANRHR